MSWIIMREREHEGPTSLLDYAPIMKLREEVTEEEARSLAEYLCRMTDVQHVAICHPKLEWTLLSVTRAEP